MFGKIEFENDLFGSRLEWLPTYPHEKSSPFVEKKLEHPFSCSIESFKDLF